MRAIPATPERRRVHAVTAGKDYTQDNMLDAIVSGLSGNRLTTGEETDQRQDDKNNEQRISNARCCSGDSR